MKLLVVDDHCLIRQGVSEIIRSWSESAEVHEADSVASALAACTSTRFDLVLLDLGLPDQTGMALLGHLRAYQEEVSVAVISEHEDPAIVARCIELGAMAFLSKSAQYTSFRQDLIEVLHGGSVVPDGVPPPAHRPATQAGAQEINLFGLTPRERDVMNWLARGYTNKKIAKEVGVGPGTVKLHVSGIMRKMSVQTRGEVIAKYTTESVTRLQRPWNPLQVTDRRPAFGTR